MRITINFDSASTEQVRKLSVALNAVLGDNTVHVGVEGPEGWHGSTPHLSENQCADVVGRLVKVDGIPIGDLALSTRTAL